MADVWQTSSSPGPPPDGQSPAHRRLVRAAGGRPLCARHWAPSASHTHGITPAEPLARFINTDVHARSMLAKARYIPCSLLSLWGLARVAQCRVSVVVEHNETGTTTFSTEGMTA